MSHQYLPRVAGRFAVIVVSGWLLSQAPLLAQSSGYRPVTDEMLQNPDPADWLNWRRTLDGWGYSPLEEITTENAHDLRLAWSWALAEGSQQTTPLVHDGIMYIANPGAIIHALDGATGELIWEYRRANLAEHRNTGGPPPGRMHRNIAIYNDTVIINTSDAWIVAIDARTGAERWEANIGADDGYQFSSGSIVADGTVVAGLTGCGIYREGTCYVVGLDAGTGQELWRTSTVALPGERGGDSWGDLPVMFRAGSDAWIPGSYDPASRTILIGTSQAKPWHREARGTDGDALYTNSTLALDPATGELKWYYQHLPAETHDMDEVFERLVIDVDGEPSVFSMGKIGVLWHLDLATGRFKAAHDLGYQTLVDIDPQTGAVTYRDGMLKGLNEDITWCPTTSGFKSWRAMAYHPETEAVYIPLILNCETGRFGPVEQVPGGGGTGPVRRTNHFHPASPEHLGEFAAMSIRTGEILWSHRYRTPIISAALTTGGGLAFAGDWDRYIRAYSVHDGDVVWETRLPQSVQGYPITYAVEGKQYVAVPVGTGGASWTSMPIQLTPEKRRPVGGNGLFVFALPDPLP